MGPHQACPSYCCSYAMQQACFRANCKQRDRRTPVNLDINSLNSSLSRDLPGDTGVEHWEPTMCSFPRTEMTNVPPTVLQTPSVFPLAQRAVCPKPRCRQGCFPLMAPGTHSSLPCSDSGSSNVHEHQSIRLHVLASILTVLSSSRVSLTLDILDLEPP